MTCAVYGCKSRGWPKSEENSKVSFHRFPEDEKLRALWVKVLNREKDWKPSQSSRLCSKHFTPECYREDKKRKILCRDAIPTIFTNHPRYLQKEVSLLARKTIVDRNRKLRVIERNLQRALDTGSRPSQPSTSRKPCGQAGVIERNQQRDLDTGSQPSQADGSPKSLVDSNFDDTPQVKKLKKALIKEATISARRRRKLKLLQQNYRRLKQRYVLLEKMLKSKNYLNDESNILNENHITIERNTINYLKDDSNLLNKKSQIILEENTEDYWNDESDIEESTNDCFNNESNILNENQITNEEHTKNYLNNEPNIEQTNESQTNIERNTRENGGLLKRYNLKKTVTVYVVKR